jgi:uncharacterized membrane protein YjjB (DUF3815 family)
MRRRRRNPDVQNWLVIGLVGIGAYVVYRLWSAGSSAATAGVNSVSQSIANLITKLTLPPPVVVSTAGRMVAMPDGSSLPLSSFTNIVSNPDGSPTLKAQYGTTTYTIDSDGQGNYFAY